MPIAPNLAEQFIILCSIFVAPSTSSTFLPHSAVWYEGANYPKASLKSMAAGLMRFSRTDLLRSFFLALRRHP